MNKKGSARDVLMFGILIFAIAIGLFVINFIMTSAIDAMTSTSEINASNETVTVLEATKTSTLNRLDLFVLALFIGLVLAIIISGWLVGGHPIFMFLYFIVVIIGVIVSAFLSNVWETFTQSATFGTTIANFAISNNILLNLPIYTTVIGFIGIIVMFAKPVEE